MANVAFIERIKPEDDRLLTYAKLGERWACHPRIAQERVQRWNLPVVKFNGRSHAVRLSDVMKAEAEAMK